jgi:hypothetical protein
MRGMPVASREVYLIWVAERPLIRAIISAPTTGRKIINVR